MEGRTVTPQQQKAPKQWVLEAVDDLVDNDSPWTSYRELAEQSVFSEFSEGKVRHVAGQLADDGKLVEWHGLVTIRRPEYLRPAAERERGGNRDVLLRKLESELYRLEVMEGDDVC